MRLHQEAQRELDDAQARGHDLVFVVSEGKRARHHPWRLALRYWTPDPATGQQVRTKVTLRWFRTQEQAYAACENLQAQECTRVARSEDAPPEP